MLRINVLVVAVVAFASMAQAVTIMAHYDMEDQSNTQLTDVSGNVRHAPFGGSGQVYVTDSAAGSYAYNRTGGWQSIPSVTAPSGVLSLSFWYKDADAAQSTEMVWGVGATATRSPWVYVSNSTNVQKLATDWNGTSDPRYQTSDNNVIVRDTWQHIVLVMDSGNDDLKAYVDTALKIDRSDGTNIAAVMGGHFGISPGGTLSQVAQFDDIQFYDGALSASDVSYLYNNPGLVVPEPWTMGMLGLGLLGVLKRRRRV